jgi:hypothetical protein
MDIPGEGVVDHSIASYQVEYGPALVEPLLHNCPLQLSASMIGETFSQCDRAV